MQSAKHPLSDIVMPKQLPQPDFAKMARLYRELGDEWAKMPNTVGSDAVVDALNRMNVQLNNAHGSLTKIHESLASVDGYLGDIHRSLVNVDESLTKIEGSVASVEKSLTSLSETATSGFEAAKVRAAARDANNAVRFANFSNVRDGYAVKAPYSVRTNSLIKNISPDVQDLDNLGVHEIDRILDELELPLKGAVWEKRELLKSYIGIGLAVRVDHNDA